MVFLKNAKQGEATNKARQYDGSFYLLVGAYSCCIITARSWDEHLK